MYQGFNLGCSYRGVCDVGFNFKTYFDLLVNKVSRMFVWDNLPETVDQRYLETLLLLNGKAAFTKVNDKFYVVRGNWGGEPNCYYQPTLWTMANPILGSKALRIRQLDGTESVEGLDAILIGNSDVDLIRDNCETGGLYGLIYQTAGLLADNISSLNVSQINGRVSVLYTADSEAEALTGEKVLQDIYEGKPYKILSQNILEKIGVNTVAAQGQSNTLMSLIEAHRSILQDFYNEIGIGYQGNSKRERVNTAEVGLMRGCLDCSLEGMLKCRQEAVEKINDLYNLKISVKINEDIYYEGSGNATLGQEELQVDGVEEDAIEQEDEKNDVNTVNELEEKGEANTNEKD